MKSTWRRISLFSVICFTLFFAPGTAPAEETAPQWVSQIVSLQGQVLVKRAGGAAWQPVALNDTFFAGDALRVAVNSRAGLRFANESMLRVDQHTTLVFNGIEKKKTFLLELIKGAAYFFSRKSRSLKVTTPFVNGVVEGTEFLVQVDDRQTDITLYEGSVLARNSRGEIVMTRGERVTATAKMPPQRVTVVHPRDAVQWALYYPPIIRFSEDFFTSADPGSWTSKLRRSIEALDQGDYALAFDRIDGLGDTVNDARFYVYRAGLLLFVGRVDSARKDIARALDLDDKNSAAMALQAIMAVVRNRKEEALHDARTAVLLNPQSASARMALSYALQAHFDLAAALDTVAKVVETEPKNGLAWARLAELCLSTGDLDAALAAARNAAELLPNLAHIQTVLGFAHLTRIKIGPARAAFDRAIALDSAAPLPRLGLGLALIRRGDLQAGRSQLEIAVSLDPDNALLRSYLGKAYFDERREPLDERQFEMAKRLDPNDPTPWFYDAIRKQNLNRPIEALHDLEKSIELNDNRAVYRSRLLLDQDLAVRSASLGRIYRDLGFEESAIREGYNSLAIDPANYSAHRLLADAYATRPRYNIARVSELLQSQLLQPLNFTPVQPQMAESNLKIQEGAVPGTLSRNNYYALFAGNGVSFSSDFLAGDHGTLGDELTLSAIYDRLAFSTGQFHYQTDGSRTNNSLYQNLHNVFIQAAVTPKINLQAEYRYKDSNHGDLSGDGDTEDPYEISENDAQVKTFRAGLNIKPQNQSNLIVSLMTQDHKEKEMGTYVIIKDVLEFPSATRIDYDGWIGELQYLHTFKRIGLVAGGGHYRLDTGNRIDTGGTILEEDYDLQHSNGYLYSNINFPPSLTWTLGVSYDAVDDEFLEKKDKTSYKAGLVWQFVPQARLRLAAFQTMKRTLLADQTIEPTQVAGFNQFFDDTNSTESENLGAAIDYKLSRTMSVGFEFFRRNLTHPYAVSDGVEEEDWKEDTYRSYLAWAPLNIFALNVTYEYEDFRREEIRVNTLSSVPLEMTTQIIPIQVCFFAPSGFYGKLKHSLVDQRVLFGNYTDDYESDDFTITDLIVGYRFQQRTGYLSAEIRNLFDTDFNFTGFDVRTPQYNTPPYFAPDKTFILRVTLSF